MKTYLFKCGCCAITDGINLLKIWKVETVCASHTAMVINQGKPAMLRPFFTVSEVQSAIVDSGKAPEGYYLHRK